MGGGFSAGVHWAGVCQEHYGVIVYCFQGKWDAVDGAGGSMAAGWFWRLVTYEGWVGGIYRPENMLPCQARGGAFGLHIS